MGNKQYNKKLIIEKNEPTNIKKNEIGINSSTLNFNSSEVNVKEVYYTFEIKTFPIYNQDCNEIQFGNVKFASFNNHSTAAKSFKNFKKWLKDNLLSYSIYKGELYFHKKVPFQKDKMNINEVFKFIQREKECKNQSVVFCVYQTCGHFELDDFVEVLDEMVKSEYSNTTDKVLELEDYLNKMCFDFSISSNRIEGSSITKSEGSVLLKNGIIKEENLFISDGEGRKIDKKEFRKHFEFCKSEFSKFYNSSIKIDMGYLTESYIQNIHSSIMCERKGKIENDQIGKYRKVKVYIASIKGVETVISHTPPSPEQLKDKMKEYIDWLHQQNDRKDIIMMAAEAHHRFESIHPFVDGNGRTGRIIMNTILLIMGYPPSVIFEKTKSIYFQSLKYVDKKKDYQLLSRIIAEGCYRSFLIYKKKFCQKNVKAGEQ